jgi:predicted nucleic acid-binding protein
LYTNVAGGDTDETILFLSVLTLGEIRNGIERLNTGRRRGQPESWLTVDLRVRFRDRILTVDEPFAERWGALSATAAKKEAFARHRRRARGDRFASRSDARRQRRHRCQRDRLPTFNPWQ